MNSVLTYAVIQWVYPLHQRNLSAEAKELKLRAHEIMNLNDHVADLDCIISILNNEGEWELADDLIKISKSFEEVVEKLRSLAANDNYNI